jgi:DNA-binding MarR family transcriptional regulator
MVVYCRQQRRAANRVPLVQGLRGAGHNGDALDRGESPTDRRIVYLDLTASGREAVESYFASLQAAGLPTLA